MIYEKETQVLVLVSLGVSGWAVLEREDGQRFDYPAEWLPKDAVEGDVLMLRRLNKGNDCNLRLFVDHKATQDRAKAGKADDASVTDDQSLGVKQDAMTKKT